MYRSLVQHEAPLLWGELVNRRQLLAIVMLVLVFMMTLAGALGFSTLSASQTDIVSNDKATNGPAWLLTVAENGNDQYAVGTFAGSDIKASNGTHAQYDLKLEIKNTQNTCQYSFDNNYVPIYNVQVKAYSFTDLLTGADSKDCIANPLHVAYAKESLAFKSYCYIKQQTGQVLPLSTPTTVFSSEIIASANGKTVNGTVGNTGQRTVSLVDPSSGQVYATASWQGNLASGEQCKNPSDGNGVIGVTNNGNFQLSDATAYKNYDSTAKDLYNCLGAVSGGNTFPSHDQYLACVKTYNDRSNQLLTKTANPYWANAVIGNGQARITLSNLVQYPVMTFRAKLSWLGIVIPVGKPKIISLETQPFTEGSTGNIHATIKNIGDSRGAFSVTSDCADIAAQASISRTLQLDPQNTGDVDLPITCKAITKEVKATCTVTVQDVNNPSYQDKMTVSADCKPISICTPTAQRCNNEKTVQVCNSAGSSWEDQTVCPEACQINSEGNPECVTSKGAIDTTTQPPPPGHGTIPFKLLGFGIALIIFRYRHVLPGDERHPLGCGNYWRLDGCFLLRPGGWRVRDVQLALCLVDHPRICPPDHWYFRL